MVDTSCPNCSGLHLSSLKPDAAPYPQGAALQYNWSLLKDPMEKNSSVSCRIPLSQLAQYSADYVLKYLTMTIFWDKNYNTFPFSIQLFDAAGVEIPNPNPGIDFMFAISHINTSGEIEPVDLIVTVTNNSNKQQEMSLGGMVVGDRR